MNGRIRVAGLKEFNRALRQVDGDLPKTVRVALNGAAKLVVDTAKPKVPTRTGRAARSIRAASTRTQTRVRGGGGRVPYFPWLDYGGEGRRRGRPAARPFRKEGRYLYPAFYATRDQVEEAMVDGLTGVARSAGWDVSGGG